MGFVSAEVLAAAQKVANEAVANLTGGSYSSNLWLAVAVAALVSSVVAGLITSVMGNLRASAATRRDGYVNAVRVLIARAEYPYRVRRRVSDDPDVLAALASRGHDLQEQVAACRTWVNSEHQTLGALFDRALGSIDTTVNPSTADAWRLPPITTAPGMNLAGWGPGDQWTHLASLQRAIAYRFGWRRLLPAFLWRRWV